MRIEQVAEGAYFVPSYSVQNLTPSYDTKTTIQSLGADVREVVEDFTATEISPSDNNTSPPDRMRDVPAQD